MKTDFWNGLNYSSCNEDGYAELRALNLSAGDTVCCVTGSGDRVLHLLLADPACVYAVDMNSAQNHLLELKMAAIRALDYDGYAGFLGLAEMQAEQRLGLYADVRKHMSMAAAVWFDSQRRALASGILYAGRWERHFAMTARNLRLQRGGKVERLLAFRTADAQQAFVKDEWDTLGWRLALRLSFSWPMLRLVFGDPGFYAYADATSPAWERIHARINGWLERHPARESFMLALVFKGRFFDPVHYPPYLREDNFETLKARLGRVRIRTCPLFDFLAGDEAETCGKFSLSDVSSFLSATEYDRLFGWLARRENIRFCLRDFLTRRRLPPSSAGIRFLDDLQRDLARDDASIGYDFIIGETV